MRPHRWKCSSREAARRGHLQRTRIIFGRGEGLSAQAGSDGAMIKGFLKVAAADAALLVALYYVLQDLAGRSAYAVSEHLVPTTSYLPFLRVLTIDGKNIPLKSPPTLDWVQVLVGLLAASVGVFIYLGWKSRGRAPA